MEWQNIEHLEVHPAPKPHWWSRRRWNYEHCRLHPLTFVDCDGCAYQPRDLEAFDWGSVPPVVRLVPGMRPDDWPASYVCHDYAYRHGGLHVRRPGAGQAYQLCSLTKRAVDRLLYRMLRAEGAPVLVARAIYRGVRLGTPFVPYPSR